MTFPVDDVVPTTAPLPEYRSHEALKRTLGREIESCNDYHGTVIRGLHYQPLLAAVYTAYSQHRPLVLTPDAVWITIAQGVAHHMTIHGERLRPTLVSHQGKLNLAFQCTDWADRSPENPWPEAFASWAGQIREHVGARIHDSLICDFSTSGPVERTASQIVMMDVFERYFSYIVASVCGIPTITLEGTPADWQRLRNKADGLAAFDLDWWLDHLLPICDQFLRASRGDVDTGHWRGICKLREDYGGDVINGWVAKLFPYLQSCADGPCNWRNPIFETGKGFQTRDAPSGLSRVPFTWQHEGTGGNRRMEAIGGLIGVAQDPQTLALRPKVGWAVREADKGDTLFAHLAAGHRTFPGLRSHEAAHLPQDLANFYHQTDGAELLDGDGAMTCRIVPAREVEPLNWGEIPPQYGNGPGRRGRIWHRFAWLADGGWLAINLDEDLWYLRRKSINNRPYGRASNAICRGTAGTEGRAGENPVIALSFADLLERLLDQGRAPYWLDPRFEDHGDAELYTRRD